MILVFEEFGGKSNWLIDMCIDQRLLYTYMNMVCEVQGSKSNWCIAMCIYQRLVNTGRDYGLLSTGR